MDSGNDLFPFDIYNSAAETPDHCSNKQTFNHYSVRQTQAISTMQEEHKKATRQTSSDANSSNEPKYHARLTAKVKKAEDQDPSIDDDDGSCSTGQTAQGTGAANGLQPMVKQPKRDRVRSVLRKMVPGAGIMVGVAVLIERILEIVVNVS